MNDLFAQVQDCVDEINRKFARTGVLGEVKRTDILTDKEYSSLRYRRAHISTIKTDKLYLLHVTVFPQTNDPSPIYGFDIVCGPSRVSGAFHDYSIAGDRESPMWLWFNAKVAMEEWNKPRDLPEWGKQIFSPAMVAIGAVGSEELAKFIKLGLETLDFYLANVGLGQQDAATYEGAQNRYCQYQKQNPRTPASLVHLGFTEQEAEEYIQTKLFPEIV